MEISKEIVSYVAELSKIKLNEEQIIKMQEEISAVVTYMDVLNTVDTTGVEPLSHVFSVQNVLREDKVKDSYDREELLKNAPVRSEDSMIVPKTVE